MSPQLLIPITYLAAMLQTWLAARWTAGGAPDLLALTAFAWLVTYGGPRGFILAALVGLVADLNSSAPLGIEMAIYGGVGYGVIWLRRQMNVDRMPAQLGVFWLAITLVTLLAGIVAWCLNPSILSARLLVERTALTGLYTTLAAVPVLMAVGWRRAKRSSGVLVSAAMGR
jgi:rod shape-determining protein MreD